MENISLALCAHVDAGKTTLSEAMLFEAGAIRKKGRVDHGDAFLDTDPIERERGITIFSKLAIMELGERRFTLMDTPGHVDFSAEAERTLAVADGAVLVVSATEPVQGHTRTLWDVLRRFDVPTVIFVNKMDLPGADRAKILRALSEGLSPACADFGEDIYEAAAMADEEAMEKYLAGKLTDSDVARLVGERRLFPVAFGSALHGEGVDKLLRILSLYMPAPEREAGFAASAYKIGRDPSGTRLTYLKLSGGTLRVKDSLDGEKCDQIREYSGEKYTLVKEAAAGAVVAVTGLEHSFAGKTYGIAPGEKKKLLRPVIRYSVELPEGADPNAALAAFRKLEEEEPQLSVGWDQEKSGISLSLMGEVQLEVIERIVRERFGITAKFTGGGIVYRETIRNTVEGVGHFEPLRHYAEVHLILEPDERGSGLTFASTVPEDELDRNWQRLILTHLAEKQHLGVLTGSPITDMRITLAAGRSHLKHTEGGDFREATYRAVRQGLMQAESVLLEPWYDFTLELPAENVGRALSDLTRMEARTEAPELGEDGAVIRGSAPASELHGYDTVLASYTRGRGRLSAAIRGYEECHNAEKVIGEIGYDPERDLSNSPDSVFCSHGAGVVVKWSKVSEKMHLESVLDRKTEDFTGEVGRTPDKPATRAAEDKELRAIFEKTYGETKRRDLLPNEERRKYEPRHSLEE
ncbi:MAG: TetM/TetW/TetO/TetS family tetracycline resistance ribosomal protection protein, partial [Oscillospiraceae bacterium]|nr:TetM/TetW/TetO/TetS family tetracycline resistance ribosomal protection protein [Oscillospiraceae bacterium]